ncbi:MAG: Plug domain-containing protein, partial [Fibrobacteria bacterium]
MDLLRMRLGRGGSGNASPRAGWRWWPAALLAAGMAVAQGAATGTGEIGEAAAVPSLPGGSDSAEASFMAPKADAMAIVDTVDIVDTADLADAADTPRAAEAAVAADSAVLELPARNIKAAGREIVSAEIKSEFIRKIPSTMDDPVRAVSFTPGVTVQSDVNIRPFVRGGDAEQTRVVMNGLPLLQAYHVGGVFSLFNLGTLEAVELYKDDFPVEYPGALSGVLRLKNNAKFPDKPRMHADLSLLRGDVLAEIPIVKDKFSVYAASQTFLFNRSLHGLLNLTSSLSGDSVFQEEIKGYKDHINMPDFIDYHAGASYAASPDLRIDYLGSVSGDGYAVVVPRASNIFSRINPKFGDPTAPVAPPSVPKKPDPLGKKLSIDSISSVEIGNQMHFLNLAWD